MSAELIKRLEVEHGALQGKIDDTKAFIDNVEQFYAFSCEERAAILKHRTRLIDFASDLRECIGKLRTPP